MSEDDPRVERARRLGARIAIGVFAVWVVGFTAWWTTEIIQQVWFTRVPETAAECRSGIQGLITAIERAKKAAAEAQGEQAAVTRFRKELSPEWDGRAALTRACRNDPTALRGLASVDGLRYAEENAARSEASDLAERRRAIQALSRELAPR
jgi:hypothetical protein